MTARAPSRIGRHPGQQGQRDQTVQPAPPSGNRIDCEEDLGDVGVGSAANEAHVTGERTPSAAFARLIAFKTDYTT
jgi:hypothetical protein